MQIRRIEYGSPQYQATLELRNRLLRLPLGLDVHQENLETEREQWHYVLEDGATVVGCVVAVPKSATHAKIRQMAIDADQQHRGYGRQLLEQVERDLAERGIATVELAARREAVGFYQKLGYRAVGEEFVEVGIPHLQVEKTLSPEAENQP